MTDPFLSAIDDLLSQECTPGVVRRIEQGGSCQALWASLLASGFADALLPEAEGGAGLALQDVAGMLERCGAHALPLPFGETMLARALLAASGVGVADRPAGPITFTTGRRHAAGLRCDAVPDARDATHVVVQVDDTWWLLDMASATAERAGFALDVRLEWPAEALRRAVPLRLPASHGLPDVRALQACVHAALLAGAAGRVLDMTLAYANQRVQFGRVIGKFQAVQHHLAVMSEHVAAARAAARVGCLSASWTPIALHAALAKARTSEAALEVARLGHAIHGAIGFTEEFDLQLYTRRLHAWRRAAGAETAWHDSIGRVLVDEHGGSVVDLIRDTLRHLPETTA